jgi:branched-chain amino acid transport system permease protein
MKKKDKVNKDRQKNFIHNFELTVSKHRVLLCVVFGVILILAPHFAPNIYMIRIMCVICVYVSLGLALNILMGQIGLTALGQAGFVGIGAYTAAILITKTNLNFLLAAILGAFLAGIFGLLVGVPTLRLSGAYLAIVTIGFGEIMRTIFMNWTSVTGGTLGIKNIPMPKLFGIVLRYENYGLYYIMLFIAVLVALICLALNNSKYGRAFAAIKQDDLAAKLMGVEVVRYKIMAFVISAAICGFVGSFYAMMQRYIDANSFTGDMSIMIVSIVITGGLGTIRGPILGSILMVALPEIFRGIADYRFIVYGLLLVIMLRVRPSGILGWRSTLPYKLPKGTLEMTKFKKGRVLEN